ncbi:hydroxymethylglutaryl-CoA reductase, degradative [Spirochaeta cellobiosiphila]|uniref:hydroxymethylglutaryl-CoA reductase, degradative n=1 Tax=Spirochaeta cellobiosiphila TaxID=504483 RepID=UPI000413A15C|nr:hydroxymethylglutaryl-CoA reductase, degradative [Spirochaeta cellobiosiphila]
MNNGPRLPMGFRKKDPHVRRQLICELWNISEDNFLTLNDDNQQLLLSDQMIENAIGTMPIPLGIVTNMLINDKSYTIPLVTEEPSVIAAANYASQIISRKGGFTASTDKSIMIQQVFIDTTQTDVEKIPERIEEIKQYLYPQLQSMIKRGGGLHRISIDYLKESLCYKLELYIDVCDAMGANLLNTIGESMVPWIEEQYAVPVIMTILSNSGIQRQAHAQFTIPVDVLKKGNYSGHEVAKRIVRASIIAQEDFNRAVTHNKGIMNGVSALALATGNDTRAVEASIHSYAACSGQYKALSQYRIEDNNLIGSIDLPVMLGTVGGSISYHPISKIVHQILGNPNANELGTIAASLGLSQNFAALFALVSEGIQKGHMNLHKKKEGKS